MADTNIQWTDVVWNPTRGCSRVSRGCGDRTGGGCYAERQAHRFSGPGQPYDGLTTLRGGRPGWTGEVRFIPDMLAAPLHWRKPRRVFVNSMSDLFHERVTNEQIAAVFGVMAACPQHTFQVLTKRPERMRRFLCDEGAREAIEESISDAALHWPESAVRRVIKMGGRYASAQIGEYGMVELPACWEGHSIPWPLPNVWLGVSVEDQQSAAERIPHLLEVPAAVRFVSAEPLLEAVDLEQWMWPTHWSWDARFHSPEEARDAGFPPEKHRQCLVGAGSRFIDWVIAGGESGPGARPCAIEWIRSLRDQCRAAGVPFFAKQLGAAPYMQRLPEWHEHEGSWSCELSVHSGRFNVLLKDSHGADMAEWPPDLRVREWPGVRDG